MDILDSEEYLFFIQYNEKKNVDSACLVKVGDGQVNLI